MLLDFRNYYRMKEQLKSCNKRHSHCITVVPGADVERPVDLEDPLDVQRLLSQPRPVGSTQEDSVSPHHWEHTTKVHSCQSRLGSSGGSLVVQVTGVPKVKLKPTGLDCSKTKSKLTGIWQKPQFVCFFAWFVFCTKKIN